MFISMNQAVVRQSAGFSLIEMIVSLGLFSVVVTIALGAMLMLVAVNENIQGEQSVMTNLAFALDSMTREIRLGTEYYCDQANNYAAGGPNNIFEAGNDIEAILTADDTWDCEDGKNPDSHALQGVAFNEGGDSITTAANNRILYFFDSNVGQLFRKVGAEAPVALVSTSSIAIQRAEFFVTGSEPWDSGAGDAIQPAVTIVLEATERSDPGKVYRIQTTVTQRALDI